MKFVNILLTNKGAILALYIAFALAASIQSYLLTPESMRNGKEEYSFTFYNNYLTFKNSFKHLIENKDLYIRYPKEHDDLYKYSPTCAVFFGIFYALPDTVGLLLWNVLNAIVLLISVYYLPHLPIKTKGLILISILIELMTCMQNEQSNGLICGLIILAFGLLERGNYFAAVFCIVFATYMKLFGIVALSLFIFYPGKWKLAFYTLFWSSLLFIVPLTVVSFPQLEFLYSSWGRLLSTDHSASVGFSVAAWLKSWFSIDINKTLITLAGAALFCSVLIWVVIFNHKAESPTFIIAMTGAAIWFFSRPLTPVNLILFLLAFVFTSLSPTDIFPRELKAGFFFTYAIKAVPCIFIWFRILYEQLFMKDIQLQPGAQRFGLTI